VQPPQISRDVRVEIFSPKAPQYDSNYISMSTANIARRLEPEQNRINVHSDRVLTIPSLELGTDLCAYMF